MQLNELHLYVFVESMLQ